MGAAVLFDLSGYRTEKTMQPFSRNQPTAFPVGHITVTKPRSWLGHSATCRKVAGLIPDEAIGIFWLT
jgi:hypothetical protein